LRISIIIIIKDFLDSAVAIVLIYEFLNISPKFVLLTNNPDKINAMKNMNIEIISTCEIEFKPNPFNQMYLIAKAASGHNLVQTKTKI
jgi:3,4-dihydroxy 2-butanone 4-phosphate synthase/GTP cyclohydrolase II